MRNLQYLCSYIILDAVLSYVLLFEQIVGINVDEQRGLANSGGRMQARGGGGESM
jgi:hypothetical protein